MLVTYFGLCFLAVGSALYAMRCPTEIKQYPTAVDYVAGVRPHIGDVQFARMEVGLKEIPRYGEEQKLLQGHFLDRNDRVAGYEKRDAYDPLADRQQLQEGYYRDLLDLNYRYLNSCRPLERSIVVASYGIGLAILAIPTANAFWRVFSVALQQFST